jgi:hypothetical protein
MEPNEMAVPQPERVNPTILHTFIVISVTLLICVISYFLFLQPAISVLKQESLTKDNQIKNLEQLADNQEVELTSLRSQLQEARESVVILEREMTTFGDFENSDNLLNRNSLFNTVEAIELRAEPSIQSDVLYSIESGVTGEVTEGPRLVDEEVWWRVAFRTEEEGWVREASLERVPSVVIRIDLDQDGESDIKIRWEGEYDLNGIVAEPGTDGTYIRYKGEAMPEPYKVTEL